MICLRCGECCYAWIVRLPNGEIKPERERCRYYSEKNGLGICAIYDSPDRPKECRDFILPGLGGVCALGQAIAPRKKKEMI